MTNQSWAEPIKAYIVLSFRSWSSLRLETWCLVMSDQTRIVKMWCHWLEFHYEYLMINWLAGRWENSLQTCFMREPFLLMCFIEWIFSYRLGSWGSCFTKYFLVDSQINISDEKIWLIPGLIGRWRRCQVCILWDSAVIQDKNWASVHRYYHLIMNIL